MTWYRDWFGTPYYRLLYGHRDDREAERWVGHILHHWGLVKGARVLDMACGRGRHARHFAQAGMSTVGIDLSAESISEARRSIPDVEFHVHDMRIPLERGRFDGVCCLFTSLGYSGSLDDDRAVFTAAYRALVAGGRFVLDFMNAQVVLRDLVAWEEVVKEGVRFEITRRVEQDTIIKAITVHDGAALHRFEERVRALLPGHLERLAKEAGFTIERTDAGPGTHIFDPGSSDRFVLWMRKPLV